MEKYEKIRVVGRGAFGTVHLCRRLDDQKLIILKEIPVDEMTLEERQSSLNESKVLSMLCHPNIIGYYDNFLEDELIVIAMEYAQGGTLFDYLQNCRDRLLQEDEVLFFFAQLLLALQHVHSRQILHRDLKTQNILLDKSKNVIKIGDFGISKVLSTKSKAFTVIGTPAYISPELYDGKPYNQKSDIWALGCVLYELLTLRRPFEATTLAALIVKIMKGTIEPISKQYSSDISQLLRSMLNLDPKKRPSVNELMAQPIMINSCFKVCTTLGLVPRRCKTFSTNNFEKASDISIKNAKVTAPVVVITRSAPNYSIILWTDVESLSSLPLPSRSTDIKQIALGGIMKIGLTADFSIVYWEKSCDANFIPRTILGTHKLKVSQVSCGMNFTVILTAKNVLLTFGDGSNGCLGHGNFNDQQKPKIVEELLGYEVISISCGEQHVMVFTSDGEIFSWGKGGNGRLGTGNADTQNTPRMLKIPCSCKPKMLHCGKDTSFVIFENQKLYACGNNKFNRLAMDTEEGDCIDEVMELMIVKGEPFSNINIDYVSSGLYHTAVITTEGILYTVGSNQFGQLGWGKLGVMYTMPGQVNLACNSRITRAFCGDGFTIATTGAKLYRWGKGKVNEKIPDPIEISIPEYASGQIVDLAGFGSSFMACFKGTV